MLQTNNCVGRSTEGVVFILGFVMHGDHFEPQIR